MKTQVFFRNDDVNRPEPGLEQMTDLFLERGIPLSHAVEPANLAPEVRDWLLAVAPRGVEIIQHGYAHTRHDRGEFGGARSAEEQRRDLEDGIRIMREAFGDAFFPAMSLPFGLYNEHTPPLLDACGYKVFSSHRRHGLARQAFYLAGRVLGRGRLLDRHVSHHLRNYPGTSMLEVSVSISAIRRYRREEGPTACDFWTLPQMQAMFRDCRRQSPVVGVVLHHRFRAGPDQLRPLAEFLDWILAQSDVEPVDMSAVWQRYRRP